MKGKIVIVTLLMLMSVFSSFAQRYGGGQHTHSHGGRYSGSHGSSHKGGHYKNARTHNHYGRHKK